MNPDIVNPTGIKWPLQFANGRICVSSGEDHIRESLMQVLAISKGEYLLRPSFGSDLRRRVFDPVNLAPLMARDIESAVARMEPRVELIDIQVETKP